MSVLGFTNPAVSPTNLIYNVVATPGGVYRYVREGRVAWALALLVALGALPGVLIGAILRVTYFSDPSTFKVFVGLVLLYLGATLLYRVLQRSTGREQASREPETPAYGRTVSDEAVRTLEVSWGRMGYGFGDKSYSFGTVPLFLLSLAVGVIGGIYSIGGGSIIAPFLVAVFGLPVHTVAGAALVGTFITSVVGVAFFEALSVTAPAGAQSAAPDWLLGAVLEIGGLAGTYVGARVQKYLPDLWIRVVLGVLVTLLASSYLGEPFRS